MKVLIVEDEQLAVAKITQTLNKVSSEVEIIGVTDSIQATVDWLGDATNNPDVILMDIELADGQSFAIFEKIPVLFPVIFTTSYDEFALKAFKVNSIDYLLKPIQQDELKAALNKLKFFGNMPNPAGHQALNIEKLVEELQRQSEVVRYRKRFLVKHLQKLVSIDVTAISHFYCEDRVNFFKTAENKNYIVDYTLDEIESMLDPELFFRINRSFIVSTASVAQIQPYFNNRLLLKLSPESDKEVTVSREKVGDFKNWLGK
jgi:DNA-binding LytR/AlgR family response regulator